MQIDLKNEAQIRHMQKGGAILSKILNQLVQQTQVGTDVLDIETKAQTLINKSGCLPSFPTVADYKWATCININESTVHGIPKHQIIKDGDVVTIDIGLIYQELHSDMSTTFQVGTTDAHTQNFLQAGSKALQAAISVVKPGNYIGHISQALEQTITLAGYQPIPNLTGHGIGKRIHEYPPIPPVLISEIDKTPQLKTGMTIAIEIIYTQGNTKIITDQEDGWTICTQDGKISAVYEKTIAVVSDGYLILTP